MVCALFLSRSPSQAKIQTGDKKRKIGQDMVSLSGMDWKQTPGLDCLIAYTVILASRDNDTPFSSTGPDFQCSMK